ncbi:hypothetical protein WIW50_09560 [Flavobacteriaceae bacterium 3-367]|uniref:hypothetical protein n=1 Tax=Eudoraea algarum TaxID=3417568 RepID=UPI0032857B78
MKKFVLKCSLYVALLLLVLELLVRVFHLYTEDPPRFIDDLGVEKRVPNSTGYAVTGNRNQNFSEFRINSFGFNSFREFHPSIDEKEIALIGDSFIEGFHQDYDRSTGKKMEVLLGESVAVYEYGYAGYDLANQLYLTKAYEADFEAVDYIIFYLDYPTDLERSEYVPNKDRITLLSSRMFKIRDQIKLLAYTSRIGLVDPIKRLALGIRDRNKQNPSIKVDSVKLRTRYQKNFEKLLSSYPIDKSKTAFLLNSKTTDKGFLAHCRRNNIQYIDFGKVFEHSQTAPTLIYDQHWNDHGRDLVAQAIVDHLKAQAPHLLNK